MSRIRYITAGESHGRALVGILEGMPAGLSISVEEINKQLGRRQQGYGRGERMQIERDRVEILSGVRFGKTIGSPICLKIDNRDWENWREKMDITESGSIDVPPVTIPRPGHADIAGSLKYGHQDIRNVLERSSARETAIRVALSAVARKLLEEFGITVVSHVIQIGKSQSLWSTLALIAEGEDHSTSAPPCTIEELSREADKSPVRCVDAGAEARMVKTIDEAKAQGDSVGGVFEVIATNVPVGLGTYAHWDRRLDGRIAQALMSIPAIKAVEIGLGRESAERWGSDVHDEIFFDKDTGYYRRTNNAGGIEGGVSNGEPIVARATMKPIPTLTQPLSSVDIATKEPTRAHVERSDVCAVPSASVVGETVLTLVLADVFSEKYGGDSLEEMKRHFDASKAGL